MILDQPGHVDAPVFDTVPAEAGQPRGTADDVVQTEHLAAGRSIDVPNQPPQSAGEKIRRVG